MNRRFDNGVAGFGREEAGNYGDVSGGHNRRRRHLVGEGREKRDDLLRHLPVDVEDARPGSEFAGVNADKAQRT